MKLIQIRRTLVPGIAVVALAASLAACGSDTSTSTVAADAAGSGSAAGGTIAGGGSSAQETAQGAWRAGFGQVNPDATISYDAVGSGDGRAGLISGKYDFVGSDSAMTDDELAQAKATCGTDPIEFPVFISPIDVIYNVEGVDDLNLDATTLAGIFDGSITTWNDKAIAALNPDATLPSTTIVPVHRSDSSGTTDNFTDYLSKASAGAWKSEQSSDWPTTTGESGEGTSGLVSSVKAADGAIGYADDSGVEGQGLGVASIKVGSDFVAPSADGAAAALSASTQTSGTPASVITYDLDRTSTDSSTYPIFMASYEIACAKYDDAGKAATVKAFLDYITSENGQKAAQANAYSAVLPSDIASAAQAQIAKIS